MTKKLRPSAPMIAAWLAVLAIGLAGTVWSQEEVDPGDPESWQYVVDEDWEYTPDPNDLPWEPPAAKPSPDAEPPRYEESPSLQAPDDPTGAARISGQVSL